MGLGKLGCFGHEREVSISFWIFCLYCVLKGSSVVCQLRNCHRIVLSIYLYGCCERLWMNGRISFFYYVCRRQRSKQKFVQHSKWYYFKLHVMAKLCANACSIKSSMEIFVVESVFYDGCRFVLDVRLTISKRQTDFEWFVPLFLRFLWIVVVQSIAPEAGPKNMTHSRIYLCTFLRYDHNCLCFVYFFRVSFRFSAKSLWKYFFSCTAFDFTRFSLFFVIFSRSPLSDCNYSTRRKAIFINET